MLQLIYITHTYIAKTWFSFCTHTHLCNAVNQSIFSIFWLIYMRCKYINQNSFNSLINNEFYLYEMLTTNLLQAMLVRRAEQSHQHQQSRNSALLTRWAHTQSKSETITTRSSTRWSLHIHRKTATSLRTCCNLHTTYTHILRRHDSAFAHIHICATQ